MIRRRKQTKYKPEQNWRDPHMPVFAARRYRSAEEIQEVAKVRFTISKSPHYRVDPTYYHIYSDTKK